MFPVSSRTSSSEQKAVADSVAVSSEGSGRVSSLGSSPGCPGLRFVWEELLAAWMLQMKLVMVPLASLVVLWLHFGIVPAKKKEH